MTLYVCRGTTSDYSVATTQTSDATYDFNAQRCESLCPSACHLLHLASPAAGGGREGLLFGSWDPGCCQGTGVTILVEENPNRCSVQ